MTEQEMSKLLAEASDPATSQHRLYRLASRTITKSVIHMIDSMSLNADERRQILDRVTTNPNINMDTIDLLARYNPMRLLDNIGLPLLFLSDDWRLLFPDSFAKLRNTAFTTGHALFPVLSHLCLAEWRTPNTLHWATDYGSINAEKMARCSDNNCAVCYPMHASELLRRWEENKAKEAPVTSA